MNQDLKDVFTAILIAILTVALNEIRAYQRHKKTVKKVKESVVEKIKKENENA